MPNDEQKSPAASEKRERNSQEQERDCTATVPNHAHEKSKRSCSQRSREISTRDELEARLLGRCVPQSIFCGSIVSPKWRSNDASLERAALTESVPAVFCYCKQLINK
jgi:hypothetical protein